MNGLEIAAGSVPGTDHTKPGQPGWKNNQDAFDFVSGSNFLIGVVCDGCGGAEYSELGARLGARLVLRAFTELLTLGCDLKTHAEEILEAVASRVTEDLRFISEMLVSDRSMRNAYGYNHLLFTIVGVAMTEETTLVFSFGDGVYSVNGETNVIPPFPDNTPPYIAYRFLSSSMDRSLLKFEVRALLPTADVQSLLIGSDGVADFMGAAEKPIPVTGIPLGPLSDFWEDKKYTGNPDAIRRRLALANREHVDAGLMKGGLLHDDTTLLVVRRTEERS